MIPWLLISSNSFLLPIYFSWKEGVYETFYVYVFLYITSLLWHSTNYDIFWFIDMFAVSLAAWRGFVDGYNTMPLGLLLTIINTIVYSCLFFCARYTKTNIPIVYHVGIHIIVSLCVTAQMILYSQKNAKVKMLKNNEDTLS